MAYQRPAATVSHIPKTAFATATGRSICGTWPVRGRTSSRARGSSRAILAARRTEITRARHPQPTKVGAGTVGATAHNDAFPLASHVRKMPNVLLAIADAAQASSARA